MTELGEHFGQGRLDQAEFDEVTKALSARTGRDLGGLLADLPPAREESSAPQPGTRPPRPLILVPLLAAAILIAGAAAGGWVFWPLWWLVPIMLWWSGWWGRSWRSRQWQ
jgi:fatty acid desaturase